MLSAILDVSHYQRITEIATMTPSLEKKTYNENKLLLDWSIFNLKMSAILDGNHEQKSQNGYHDSTIKDTNLQ